LTDTVLVYTPPDVAASPMLSHCVCKFFKTLSATFTKEWKWEGYESVI